MKDFNWPLAIAVAVMSAIIVFLYTIDLAHGRDLGQWGDVDPELSAWYQSLRMPDNPVASCCGEADSYYCDEHARGSQIYCVINDERDNLKLKRTPVPNGTEIDIPPHKLNRDPNPTGRGVVFLSSQQHVYCFIGAGGV